MSKENVLNNLESKKKFLFTKEDRDKLASHQSKDKKIKDAFQHFVDKFDKDTNVFLSETLEEGMIPAKFIELDLYNKLDDWTIIEKLESIYLKQAKKELENLRLLLTEEEIISEDDFKEKLKPMLDRLNSVLRNYYRIKKYDVADQDTNHAVLSEMYQASLFDFLEKEPPSWLETFRNSKNNKEIQKIITIMGKMIQRQPNSDISKDCTILLGNINLGLIREKQHFDAKKHENHVEALKTLFYQTWENTKDRPFDDAAYYEGDHTWISSLFPIPGSKGNNGLEFKLTEEDKDSLVSDKYFQQELGDAFKMMLGYFGLEFKNTTEQEIDKIPDGVFEKRFANILAPKGQHNWLRLLRMIKCLGSIGDTKNASLVNKCVDYLVSTPEIWLSIQTNPMVDVRGSLISIINNNEPLKAKPFRLIDNQRDYIKNESVKYNINKPNLSVDLPALRKLGNYVNDAAGKFKFTERIKEDAKLNSLEDAILWHVIHDENGEFTHRLITQDWFLQGQDAQEVRNVLTCKTDPEFAGKLAELIRTRYENNKNNTDEDVKAKWQKIHKRFFSPTTRLRGINFAKRLTDTKNDAPTKERWSLHR